MLSKQTENKILKYWFLEEDDYFKRFNVDNIGNSIRKSQDSINFINQYYDKYTIKMKHSYFPVVVYIKKDLTNAPKDLFNFKHDGKAAGFINIGDRGFFYYDFDMSDQSTINFFKSYANYGGTQVLTEHPKHLKRVKKYWKDKGFPIC